jgi:hypothetical protein
MQKQHQHQHWTQHQQHQQQQQDPDKNHAVIAGLRASMTQVSSIASSVSQENKLLLSDNRRLQELQDQQAGVIEQLQVREALTRNSTSRGSTAHELMTVMLADKRGRQAQALGTGSLSHAAASLPARFLPPAFLPACLPACLSIVTG